ENEPRSPTGFVAGNYFDKYRSRNPVHRALMSGFLRSARDLVGMTGASRVLEVGCGPGDLAAGLFWGPGGPGVDYTGVDLCPRVLEAAGARCPGGRFLAASADALPFADRTFELVVMCEVLE